MNDKQTNWIIAVLATAMAFVEIMDMTIISVSLRQMKGTFTVTSAQISWAISIYTISAAIMMPLSGMLIMRYGRRKILLYSILGFTISSMLCGLSWSFAILLSFRFIQGITGASLAPIAQTIMAETFQGDDRNKAMAIFSMGIMSAPLFGPIIGGYLNDMISWRLVFFINFPIGMVVLFLTNKLVKESQRRVFPIDWIGIILLAVGICGIQFVLEQGNFYNWFNSLFITITSIIGAGFIILFILHSVSRENAIIPMSLFRDTRFTMAIILGLIFNLGFLGVVSLLPIELETIYNYSAHDVGWLLSPRGFSSIIFMILMPMIMRRVNMYILIMSSFLCFAFGAYSLSWQSEIGFDNITIVVATIFQGIATGCFFVPLSVIAYKTLQRSMMAQASGVFNFARAFGGSIGIAGANLLQERLLQQNWNYSISKLNSADSSFKLWKHYQPLSWSKLEIINKLHELLLFHSNFLAYINTYIVLSLIFIVGAIMTLASAMYHKFS